MPSPFPGMDPYLEPFWPDVHTALVIGARGALNRLLPGDLIAAAEERIAIEGDDVEDRRISPDVRVTELPPESFRTFQEDVQGGVSTLPIRLIAELDPITERYIKILHAKTERLITVLEFIGPTNKRGIGLHAFRRKRNELLAAGVNFVEVDLVRAGDWRGLMQPHRMIKHSSIYRATIRLPRELDVLQVQPITLREKLPQLPIPLRETDPPVRLELQTLLDEAYDTGRYSKRLDYTLPPEPPLDPDDTEWVSHLLATKR